MSKLFLRILLCAGFGLSAFPISSMEKGEQGDALGRKKPLTSSSRAEVAEEAVSQFPTRLLPDSSEKKEKKSRSKAASPKKGEPRSGSKKERGKGTQLATSPATPPSSGASRSIRSASAPKPSVLRGFEVTQAKVQQLLIYAPDTLNTEQIALIVGSPSGVSLDKNIWVTVKNKVSLLPKALCREYILSSKPFDLLLPEDEAVIYSPLVAVAEDYDLQTHYNGPTLNEKLTKEIPAVGTFRKYVIKSAISGELIKYPDPDDKEHMISAYLDLSLTITDEKKAEEKA